MKLLLLLCLGLTLVCAHQGGNHDIVTSNFDMSKISGEWYTIFLASKAKELIDENGGLRIFVQNIQFLENSSLLLEYQKKVNGECIDIVFLSDETEEKGVYGVTYEGLLKSHIGEAVYNDYYIFYSFNFKDEKTTQVVGLNARKPDVSPELRKKFEDVIQDVGIPKENIVDFTKADRCLEARKRRGNQASSAK